MNIHTYRITKGWSWGWAWRSWAFPIYIGAEPAVGIFVIVVGPFFITRCKCCQ